MVPIALRRLKDETHDLHVLAETHVHILDEDATRATYRDYLRAMYGFHAPLERVLAAHRELFACGYATVDRRKSPWLLSDLRALGDDDVPPTCTRLPAATTLARCLGIAYVLEGSTLGGRYILAKMPSALRGSPTAFLEGYGANTGPNWKAFGAIAARELAERRAQDDAIAAARDTFGKLVDWLAATDGARAAS